MAKIYVGEEKKFSIELTAPGFSMDDDDFELEVAVPKGSVKGNKENTLGDTGLLIFSETVTPEEGDPYKVWYGIIDTSKLPGTGDMKVIGTAYVHDASAGDIVRKEIAVAQLGNLANP